MPASKSSLSLLTTATSSFTCSEPSSSTPYSPETEKPSQHTCQDLFPPRRSERHPFFGIDTEFLDDFLDCDDTESDDDASDSVLALLDGIAQTLREDNGGDGNDENTVVASGRGNLYTRTTMRNLCHLQAGGRELVNEVATPIRQDSLRLAIPKEISFAPSRRRRPRRKSGKARPTTTCN